MTLHDVWQTALAVIVSLGGGGAIVLALSSWLGKVWANRILETDRAHYASELERLRSDLERSTRLLQGEIDKTIFVSKTHFETEFVTLREIWQRISTVRARMSQLRPITAIVDLRTSNEQRLAEAFNNFVPAVKELVDSVDLNSPFYPPDIFVRLDGLIQIAQKERDEIAVFDTRDILSFEGRQRGKANFDEFCSAASVVSEQIRGRLEKLSVRVQAGI